MRGEISSINLFKGLLNNYIPLSPRRSEKKLVTLPSPAGGERKNDEIGKKIPSPLRGEGEGGGDEGRGNFRMKSSRPIMKK
jgi:hypothetical protein